MMKGISKTAIDFLAGFIALWVLFEPLLAYSDWLTYRENLICLLIVAVIFILTIEFYLRKYRPKFEPKDSVSPRLTKINKRYWVRILGAFVYLLYGIYSNKVASENTPEVKLDRDAVEYLIEAGATDDDFERLLAAVLRESTVELDSVVQQQMARVLGKIYGSLDSSTKVIFKEIFKDPKSDKKRVADIVLYKDIAGYDMKVLIEVVPDSKNQIGIVDVIEFERLLNTAKGARGIIVSKSGFGSEAILEANRNQIELLLFEEVLGNKELELFKIPVLVIERIPKMSNTLGLTLVQNDLFPTNMMDWPLSLDGADSVITMGDLIVEKWNSSNLVPKGSHVFRFEKTKVEVITGANKRRLLEDFSITLDFEEYRKFAYIYPSSVVELKSLTSNKMIKSIDVKIPLLDTLNGGFWIEPPRFIDTSLMKVLEIVSIPMIQPDQLFPSLMTIVNPETRDTVVTNIDDDLNNIRLRKSKKI